MMLMQRMVGIRFKLKFLGGGYAASAGADKSGLMTLIGQQVSPVITIIIILLHYQFDHHHWVRLMMIRI